MLTFRLLAQHLLFTQEIELISSDTMLCSGVAVYYCSLLKIKFVLVLKADPKNLLINWKFPK